MRQTKPTHTTAALLVAAALICTPVSAEDNEEANAELLEFFTGLFIVIQEAYGQTEASGTTTFNRSDPQSAPDQLRFGTVGKPLPGVEVRLADDGELLVKGPNVFLGYEGDDEATRARLVDGWLHSGDLGTIDEHGFLTVTSRKRDLISTRGGAIVSPRAVELALKRHELIDEAIVVGHERDYLAALIIVHKPAAKRLGDGQALPHRSPQVREVIAAHVDAYNEDREANEHIRRFELLARPLTIDDGELTPSLKLRRAAIHEHFAEAIERLYRAPEDAVASETTEPEPTPQPKPEPEPAAATPPERA